jgi:hypothetical protein
VVTKESSVHRGQVGQPNPEPVSRTAPPVPIMSIWLTSDAQAKTFTRTSTAAGSMLHSVFMKKSSDKGARTL